MIHNVMIAKRTLLYGTVKAVGRMAYYAITAGMAGSHTGVVILVTSRYRFMSSKKSQYNKILFRMVAKIGTSGE